MLELPIGAAAAGPSFNTLPKFRHTTCTPRHPDPQELSQDSLHPILIFASLDPCTQPACTVAPSALREPLSLVAAATGRAPSSGVFTAQGFWESWASSAWANSLPPNVQFQTYSNPSKYTAPQLFYGQDHRQENPRFLISPVPSPCRERLAPGSGGFRTVPTLCLPLIPSRASLSFSPSLPLCVLQLQHKLFAREVSLYDPIQHTQEKTVGDRPNVLTNLS